MAAAPTYASTPHPAGVLVPASADTSFTAPTTTATVLTAASTGTKVNEIDVIPAGTTVAGLVNIFLYDGTNYHLLDSATIAAATLSATAGPGPAKQVFIYADLTLPSGWSIRVTTTVAGNGSLISVLALGADY